MKFVFNKFYVSSISLAVIFSLALSSFSAYANSDNDEHDVNDEAYQDVPIIVIIGKKPKPIDDVVGSASVIQREHLDRYLASDLSDLVRYETGVSVEYAGTRFGQSGLSIRGIGGNRVAMEIDGVPVADQFNIGSYSNSTRNLIELNDLQQIEILRGPASSVYGSDALGGVVNFISKKPNDLLKESNSDLYFGVKTSYYSANQSELVSVQAASAFNNFSYLLSLTDKQSEQFAHQSDSVVAEDMQTNRDKSKVFYAQFDLNDNHQFGFRYQEIKKKSDSNIQSILGLGRFASTTLLLGDDESSSETLAMTYEFLLDKSWIDGGIIRVYQQVTDTTQLTDENRVSRGTPYQYDRNFYYDQSIDGIRLNLYSQWDGFDLEHDLGYGIEWSKTRVEELRDALQTNLNTSAQTNIILSEDFPLRDFPISEIEEVGFYINDQIAVGNTNWSIIPAVRFDHYQLTPIIDSIYAADNTQTEVVAVKDSRWSPKFGALYKLGEKQQWYLQYAEGFRAPPFEDANIGLDIPLFNIRAIPNPNLKSETSKGYELGYKYSDSLQTFDWIVFHNEYDDFIQTKVNLGLDPVSGRILFQSQNLDRAIIYGTELSYQIDIYENLTWFARGFWSRGENKVIDQPLNDVAPHQWVSGLNWQTGDWSGAINMTYTAQKSQLDLTGSSDLFVAPSVTLLDLFVHYQIDSNMKVSAAINNISDQRYWHWSAVNGLENNDPLLDLLSAPGRELSVQFYIHW